MPQIRPGKPRARPKPGPFHLFVYGTLTAPTVMRAVLGVRMVFHRSEASGEGVYLAREAVLAGYKKVSPDETYLYAVPDPQGRIRGYVIGPLPGECMSALLRYEGRNYRRLRVTVQTGEGDVRAVAFVGNLPELSHSFGWRFHDHLKQEVLLAGKIDKAILEDEVSRLHTDEPLTRRALRELHGLTTRDLMRRHFEAGGISAFAIKQAIRGEPLREFGDALTDPAARALAGNYLGMLLRQVLFNQIEDRIREEFRYELDRLQVSEKFYERTISALAALRLLNEQPGLVDLLTGDLLEALPFGRHRLIEYVEWVIAAADAAYDSDQARRQIQYVQAHMGRGTIPLGAELEFSNIGHDVILDAEAARMCDARYDGFLYFRDFGLDVLTWKLGGHVDDHRVKSAPQRRRGFFELALGSLSVEANISKPITDDPWLLNRMVQAAMGFYDIKPHSLHLSLQLRLTHRPLRDRCLPLGVLKCLFALGGDPRVRPDGSVGVTRLDSPEITRDDPETQMLFSQVSRRHSSEGDEFSVGPGRWVQQFKFLRLDPGINYEPLIMALKGLQIHYRPGSFLLATQYRSDPAMRELYQQLVQWGAAAGPLEPADIEEFLYGVYEGLLREHRRKPAHSSAYIAWCLAQLRAGLDRFNGLFRRTPAGQAR